MIEGSDSENDTPSEPQSTQTSAEYAADISFLSPERRMDGTQRSREPEEELPRFHFSPADSASRRMPSPDSSGEIGHTKLWEAFTPRRPQKLYRLFAGRRRALGRMIAAIEEERAHVVIFGPRGVGKTSMANLLAESASDVEYQVLKYPCSSDSTFEDIFRGLLARLPADFLDRTARANLTGAENFEQLLPKDEFGPTELTRALSHLALEHVIFVIDEFDRITSERTKNQLAESIKNLSDAEIRATIVVLGIARSVEELVGKHSSIQRHLIGIHLPLMEPDELHHIIQLGEREANLNFDDATRDMIVTFSKGLPYFTQLLCLYSGQAALSRNSTSVEINDFRKALNRCAEEADPLVKAAYDLATRGDSNQFMTDVLFAAASARFDEYGSFTAKDASKVAVNDQGHRIIELTLHRALSALGDEKYYGMVEKHRTPSGAVQYFFANQTMRQHIMLRQLQARGLM
jgi:GTPase SAR1 family protein